AGAGELATGGGLGDSEIRHDGVPVLVEHDVVGFDVAVDDFFLVRVREGARDFGENLLDLHGRQAAASRQNTGERLAAQELHHEANHAARFADAVDRNNVGMFEFGRGTGFALEALDEFLVEGEREWQDFDRDLAIELLFLGLEDDGHAAAPQLVEDFVFLVELLAHHVDFRDFRQSY